jgi:hypothetical protein
VSRGKHRARAQRREAQRQADQERGLRERIVREEQHRAQIDADLAEIDRLTLLVLDLKKQVAEMQPEIEAKLREEIGQLLRDIAAVTFESDRARRSRDRRLPTGLFVDVEFLEEAMREHGDGELAGNTLVTGVHMSKGMTAAAVKAIQRARGLRRLGSS